MRRLAYIFTVTLAAFLLSPIARADDPNAKPSWQPVGLSGGGAMFHPAISPADPKSAIVHCDMSAAYLTHDGGLSWRMIDTAQLRSNTHCTAAFHPTDPNIIYSPHGSSAIKITRDAGLHWEGLAQFNGPLTGPITIDPHNTARMLIGVGETVRFSSDAGKTWQVCKDISGSFIGAHFIQADPTIFLATKNGVWKSSDAGKTWMDAAAGLPFKDLRSFTGGTKAGRTNLYCTLPGKNQNNTYIGGIYRWTTDAPTWQPVAGTGLNLDIKPFDQWAGNAVAQYHDIATTDDNPDIVWASNQGTGIPPPHHSTIYRSDDAGKTWRATFFPDPRYKNFNVEKGYTVVEDGQFYQAIPDISLDAHNPDHLLQINGGDCYITTDGGKTWRCGHTQATGALQPGVPWKCTGLVVTTTWNYYIDPHEAKRHFICYTDLGFARSLDAGQTWIWCSEKKSSPWRNTCYELAFDPDRPGKVWGAFSEVHDIPNASIIYGNHRSDREGGLCVSDDFAATWKPLATLPKAPCTSIILDPKSPKTARILYAAFFSKGIYKSTDDGQTWIPKNVGLGTPENMRVYRVQIHPDGTLFALITGLRKDNKFVEQGAGLYRSTNAGDSWQLITQSVAALWPKDFTLDPADSRIVLLSCIFSSA